MTLASPVTQRATAKRWLSIIGLGEDGVAGLTATARDLIQSATIVFGGSRHLMLAAPLIQGHARPWLSPFERNISEVLANRGLPVCILASGDPFQYGIGSLLSAYVDASETLVMPAPSAFSLAASRLLWPLPQTVLLSLCGRPLELIRPHLQPSARLLVLSSDDRTPAALAQLLLSLGFGASKLIVLEALGGTSERIRAARADAFELTDIGPLNTIAIEVVADSNARVLPRAVGLEEAWFEHDGQITRREIRALTLSALAPRCGELLWDVGAGAGSIAIEWLLTDQSLHAIAIEEQPDRVARVRRNASALGVPRLKVVAGSAPAALEGLPLPNVVFVGGGAAAPGLLDFVQDSLHRQGRLVVNAVTVGTEALIVRRQAQFGGNLIRVEVSRASPIGGESGRALGWRPAFPVTQWCWVKS